MHGPRMTRSLSFLPVLALALVLPVPARAADPIELVQTIPLRVEGRIDHFAIDEKGPRLFVAALGNHTVEVIDLAAGAPLRTLRGFGKPQGLAYVPGANRLYVADGEPGSVTAFDGATFVQVARVDGLADADNLRYDAEAGRLYVGYGAGGIRVFDARTAAMAADIRLPAHPEGFALAGDGWRLFANLPDAGVVAAVNLPRGELAQRWSTGEARANFPLVFNDAARRVFVATRQPAALQVYDSESGKRVAQVAIDGDADDLFFDPDLSLIFVVCGAGYVDVLHKDAGDQYRVVARIATRQGARTGLYVAAQRRLYVGVPRYLGSGAELRVFAVDASSGR
jgi:hypothetical protein